MEIAPKNQHEQVLWYLYNWKEFSLKRVINDSMFYKFQTRLGELETKHGQLTNKKTRKFTNRFGNTSNYTTYKAINKKQILNIYEKNRSERN
jgi:hypothetical protein